MNDVAKAQMDFCKQRQDEAFMRLQEAVNREMYPPHPYGSLSATWYPRPSRMDKFGAALTRFRYRLAKWISPYDLDEDDD